MFASRNSVASKLASLVVPVGTFFGIQTGVALADTHWNTTSQLGIEDTHW